MFKTGKNSKWSLDVVPVDAVTHPPTTHQAQRALRSHLSPDLKPTQEIGALKMWVPISWKLSIIHGNPPPRVTHPVPSKIDSWLSAEFTSGSRRYYAMRHKEVFGGVIDDCTSPHCREALYYRARRSFNLRSRGYISRLQQTFHLTSLNYDSRFTSSWKFATKSITIRLLSVLQDRNCDTLLLKRTQAINHLQKVWSWYFCDRQF